MTWVAAAPWSRPTATWTWITRMALVYDVSFHGPALGLTLHF